MSESKPGWQVGQVVMGRDLVPGGIPPAPEAYLVIMDRGGMFGVWFDSSRALEAARNIGGVVCTVPIAADFRQPESAPRSGTWAQDATEATPTLRAGSVIEVRDPGP
jgi:hypothetical protein